MKVNKVVHLCVEMSVMRGQAIENTSDSLLSADLDQTWRDLSTQRRANVASRMLRMLERGTLQFAGTGLEMSAPVGVSRVTGNIGS